MKNQSCDGSPGSVTQSRASADAEMCLRQEEQQVVAASSNDRMMVTTGTDAKRRLGKGERKWKYGMAGGGPARTRQRKMKLR
jgi:hypothetical protein